MDESKLFESGCCLCDEPSCPDPRWRGENPPTTFEAHDKDIGAIRFCATHWHTPWSREEMSAVRTRRLSLRSAPAPESEFYETQPDPLPETLPAGTAWGAPMRFVTQLDAPLRDGGYLFHNSTGDALLKPEKVDWTTVRKSSPPPKDAVLITPPRSVSAEPKPTAAGVSKYKPGDRVRTFPRMAEYVTGTVQWCGEGRGACVGVKPDGGGLEVDFEVGQVESLCPADDLVEFELKPGARKFTQKSGRSDPYRANSRDDADVASGTAIRDAAYRSRVAALRLDFDRPLPRTWKDKLGRLVSFDGPVGKGGRKRA